MIIYPIPDRAIASRARPAARLFAFAAAAPLFFSVLLLLACGEKAAGPSSDPVIGKWAGQVQTAAGVLLAEMDLNPGKDYQARIYLGGGLVTRERGAWATRGGRCHFAPATCEEADAPGGPLRLVVCGPPDSIAVNISGDTWPANFSAGGQVQTIVFKRL